MLWGVDKVKIKLRLGQRLIKLQTSVVFLSHLKPFIFSFLIFHSKRWQNETRTRVGLATQRLQFLSKQRPLVIKSISCPNVEKLKEMMRSGTFHWNLMIPNTPVCDLDLLGHDHRPKMSLYPYQWAWQRGLSLLFSKNFVWGWQWLPKVHSRSQNPLLHGKIDLIWISMFVLTFFMMTT